MGRTDDKVRRGQLRCFVRCSERSVHPGRWELQSARGSWPTRHTHTRRLLQSAARLAQPWVLLAT